MTFKIDYIVGKELRTKLIIANSLEDAEEKANKLFKKWINIYDNSFKKGDKFGK